MATAAGPTKRLAQFISGLEYNQIPLPVIEHLKLCLLDTLGCGLFGTTLPWMKIVTRFAQGLGGPPEGSVWGQGFKLPSPNAALVNGTAVHAFELDDLHKTSILHPGAVAATAALAMAERVGGCDGRAVLTALVAGYEAGIRVGISAGDVHLRKGFHPTGNHGTFASAAAAGRILNLDPDTMTHALGIAGTQSAGLMAAQYSSMVKRFHAGRAAQSGVYAALLAREGLTGITNILEAEYGGYIAVMGQSGHMAPITKNLGESYESAEVGFKAYSAGGSTHTAHEAVKAIMGEHELSPDDVKNILIQTTSATDRHTNWEYVPVGVTSAQMNMQYVVAITVMDGELFIDQFTDAKINDARVIDFTKKIEVRPNSELDALGPEFRHAIIAEVTTRDGKVYSKRVDSAKGSAKHPLTRDEVVTKYRLLAEKKLNRQEVSRLEEKVLHLDEVPDIGELTVLLRS